MTKEDAIHILTAMKKSYLSLGIPDPEAVGALEMAINAVKAEPCEDSISRQAVLDIVDSYSESQSNVEDVTQDIISDIVALPSVNPLAKDYNTIYYTPQPKTGHWKAKSFHELFCDNCGFDFDIMRNDFIDNMNYCPNCGAKMEKEEKP